MDINRGSHFWRALFLIILVPVLYLVVRPYLVPGSFGQSGFYRADSLSDQMAMPVNHAGDASCAKCHAKQAKLKAEGGHKSVRCESCHVPLTLSGHVLGDKKAKVMPVTKDYSLCLTCHRKLKARPKSFPQIEFLKHLKEQGYENKGKVPRDSCWNCHNPHNPFD